jgi:hypothetical protein
MWSHVDVSGDVDERLGTASGFRVSELIVSVEV